MKRTFICLIILLIAAVSVDGRTVKLTLHPAKASEPAQKCRLLPKAEEQTDADAVPLYEKAVEQLPKNVKLDQIRKWRKTPADKLPRQQVRSTLEKYKPSLQLVEQAAKCKQCNWPPFNPGTLPENLSEYRELIFVIALQARLQIAEGQYEQAIGTIRTAFTMARQIGEAPNLSQDLIGVAMGGDICREIEQLIQAPNSPNLYQSLGTLPEPLVDTTKTMELEIANLKNYNFLLRRQFKKILEPAHERVRMIMNRLDRNVAALQCVEALRLYATNHDGKFPKELSSITEVSVPSDPVTKKPFVYHCTGPNAVLEAPAPKGATERETIRYELKLKEGT
jgi:tetratricopeptide (TPR) repeat protein